MISPFLIANRMSRVGNAQRWTIIHGATHLSISILLPDTDPPNVKWILPDGRQIENSQIDIDVPAGETTCICDDFTRCGIDMLGCDPYAIQLRTYEMPIIRPRLTNLPGRYGMYRDMRYNSPGYVSNSEGAKKPMGAIHMKIIGSGMVITVDDINRKKAACEKASHTHLEVGYVPNFTGNLADLNVTTQYWYRIPNNDFTGYVDIPDRADDMVNIMQHTIIHHTGVYGHCNLSNVSPGHFGFYGNPNMTPDDYDQTCIELAASMQSCQNTGALSIFTFDASDFILDISSRRTSASDEAVATLRALGMIVNEIAD